MKQTLSREHRKSLETAIAQARFVAEADVVGALHTLAVACSEEPLSLDRIGLKIPGQVIGALWVQMK